MVGSGGGADWAWGCLMVQILVSPIGGGSDGSGYISGGSVRVGVCWVWLSRREGLGGGSDFAETNMVQD